MSVRLRDGHHNEGIVLWSRRNQRWEFWQYAEMRDSDPNQISLVARHPAATVMEASK